MTSTVLDSLSKPLRIELEKTGVWQPTEVQTRAIPLILEGKNVLIIAPTGAGKTEATVLPIFESFLRLRSEGENLRGISMLYVTPLRSLNRDILRRVIELGKSLGIIVEVRHGDTPPAARRRQALKPPNMLITTPETLQAVLAGRRMRVHLNGLRWLIIDEIHELASDKRGAQLALALERIHHSIKRDPQRIGLSATVGEDEVMGRFLIGERRQVTVVRVEAHRRMRMQVESPTPTRADNETAEKLMIPASTLARLRRIVEFFADNRTTLVFTNTREHAESLASKLHMIAPELNVGVHHGSLSRDVRVDTEQQLKMGGLKGVVCTSSLELGIDVGSIDFVVQYMSPRQVNRLVQRVGRSGHFITLQARGAIVASWADDILESAVIVRRALAGELEPPEIHHEALDVLAHQLLGLTLDKGSLSLSEAYSVSSRACPYAHLTAEKIAAVASQLASQGLLRMYGDTLGMVPQRTRQCYFENLSMIPDVKNYSVFDYITRRKIGTLDQEFVARHGKPGNEFILHGYTWRILQVDEEKAIVDVESADPSMAAIPGWEGEIIPVPFEVAQEVALLRRRVAEKIAENRHPHEALAAYALDDASKARVVSTLRKHVEDGFPVPDERLILIEGFENYIVIHCCAGDKVNQTLSRVLASLITAKTGADVALQSDQYRIALITPYPLDSEFVKQELRQLHPDDVSKVLNASIDQTNLFMWRLWHNAKRFGVVSKTAEYRLQHAKMLLSALRATPVYDETTREICLENFDVEHASQIVQRINSGDLHVVAHERMGGFSPLAMPLLDKIAPHDLIQPARERSEVVSLFKERVMNKTLRFLCVFKGDWTGTQTVKHLKDPIRCPKCDSTLIAATYRDDADAQKLVRKKLAGRQLTTEEEKKWFELWRAASLLQNYGSKAAVALASRGVGPSTAVRILHREYRGEDAFYLALLKAERDYLRTRMFWD